jgi:regulator of sigma E protease
MSAEFGVIYYLMFLALISVNLGIINLFPLPVLDGGHLLFLAIEKLKADRYPSEFKTLVIALARFCWCC